MDPRPNAFRIFDASAGSGKTFTLTREYLSLVLRPGSVRAFHRILAITFTNKAVAELKNRILSSLMQFASLPADGADAPPMFAAVMETLQTDRATLIGRSRLVLENILHNYAFFDVSTIDKFNHRILRTFAPDLGLPSNFEVVLDTDALLEESVNRLVGKAGTDKKLTDILVEFALEKAAEDRNWDISYDLLQMGKLLFDETHYQELDTFSGKDIDDFLSLKSTLYAYRAQTEKALVSTAAEILELIESHGLDASDFSGKSLPLFVQKVAAGNFDLNTGTQWIAKFADNPLYPKRVPQEVKDLLDALHPVLSGHFQQILRGLTYRDFLSNAGKNIAPFAVLGLLQQELKTLREEEGFLPISAFNTIISREIADQPVPYIYERLGERYLHYFIDEFQDTSGLQWANLVPLIRNALEGEFDQGQRGSVVLVGDAKQAIYRWRGGKAEQFLQLIDGSKNPFPFEPVNEPLPVNFRSHRTLVEFNNDFFSHISSYMGSEAYSDLFRKGNRQRHHFDRQGLVRLEFIPQDCENEAEEYASRVLSIVKELTGRGYAHGDICILTRRGKDGVLLSEYLMDSGVPVSSSETLLLKNHPGVGFLIALLHYLLVPEDDNHGFDLLFYLSRDQEDRHSWIAGNLGRVDQVLASYQFHTGGARLQPVYEVLETAIRQFRLAGQKDAYLVYLMDLVRELGQNSDPSIQTFLEYWKAKEDKLSISAPEGFDAVTLMTVHKAKGLEFPVVLFPFANTRIYYEKNPKLWLPVDPDQYAGFESVLVGKKEALLKYAPPAPERYAAEEEKLELDAYNLLYVAHTRAVKALYVITRTPRSPEGAARPKTYGDIYCRYLSENGLWQEGKAAYSFGSLDPHHVPAEKTGMLQVPYQYTARDRIALRLVSHQGRFRDAEQTRAMEYGNVLHYALSLVAHASDTERAITRLIREGMIRSEEAGVVGDRLRAVTGHERLAPFFAPRARVMNEQEILTKNGLILRPDRLVFLDGGVVVMDYKTGKPHQKHLAQVREYRQAIEEMGHPVNASIVIYIQENSITPEFI
jgi:ATP-dependent exoDNAse (exonuclease V) beta subunit